MKVVYQDLGGFEHQLLLESEAIELVGDGKEPNIFYVSVSNVIRIYNDTTMMWECVPADFSLTEIKSAIIVKYLNKDEALRFAENVELDVEEEVFEEGVYCVMVEDRLEGQIYERILDRSEEVTYTFSENVTVRPVG